MRWTTRIAALHGAYWSFDQWYRLSWYVWPGTIAQITIRPGALRKLKA